MVTFFDVRYFFHMGVEIKYVDLSRAKTPWLKPLSGKMRDSIDFR
jgi:hypothetical protein